jgi:hypothetical protein
MDRYLNRFRDLSFHISLYNILLALVQVRRHSMFLGVLADVRGVAPRPVHASHGVARAAHLTAAATGALEESPEQRTQARERCSYNSNVYLHMAAEHHVTPFPIAEC